tara:strand:+ start:5614 stop:6609 length:996 start_codon:yes stop_codon:yes gene_type:complete
MKEQRDFFPTWDKRDKLLREVPLPSMRLGSATVSSQTLYAVLQVISSFRECWLSQSTIAGRCRITNVRTVKRAVKCLESLNLITKERKYNDEAGRVLNHHRVIWCELQRRIDTFKAPDSSQRTADQSDNVTPCIEATNTDQSDNVPPTKVTMSTDQSDNEYRPRGQSVPTKVTMSTDQSDNVSTEVVRTKTTNQLGQSEGWVVMVENLERWGLAAAAAACESARSRGLSLRDVEALRVQADRLPSRVAPGKLYKWLRGDESPPATPQPRQPTADEIQRRRRREAETIRYVALREVRRVHRGQLIEADDPRVERRIATLLDQARVAELEPAQ